MPDSKQIFTKLAQAKINLTLHVGAPQADGYHPLHSLVAFADVRDELSAKPATDFNLKINGPFASELSEGGDNLVLNAARKIAASHDLPIKLAYILTKNLPIASGIGGGSADAAAAIHLLERTNDKYPEGIERELLEVGADVPVCYQSKTCLMQGIGENLTPLENLGQLPAILVNPGVAVSTGEIFKAFDTHGCSSDFQVRGDTLLEMAKSGTNDLQGIAIQIAPIIQTVIDEISVQNGCELVRMSGSGATCFGVFASVENAKNAVNLIREKYPKWWCVQAMLGDNTNQVS